MKMLNLGCGTHFHEDWVNLDFQKTGKNVIAHNLLKGIPFEDESFDVIYHSHVLEHFSKMDAGKFISECNRVLKKNGIIRVVVPDLESIAKSYLKTLESASANSNKFAKDNYEWMKLELLDQTVRNIPGGEMAAYLRKDHIPNLDFVYNRVGQEAKDIHTEYKNRNHSQKSRISKIYRSIIHFLQKRIKIYEMYKIGKFRLGGEIHQWMYDKYSLGNLLTSYGFEHIRVYHGSESKIENWEKYSFLDLDKLGNMRKPDSLIMEAIKV